MVTMSRLRLVEGGCGNAARSGDSSFAIARPVELGPFEHCGGGAPTFDVGMCASAENRC
jgi:hypothetical protein